jgi:sec-independent protein translocase protein TatA
MLHTLAIGMPGPFEWIIIAGLGLLIFGKRLPEVGRSLGKGIVEFKKGLKSVEDEVSMVGDDTTPTQPRKAIPENPAHKFDPYTGKPIGQTDATTEATEAHH